MYDQKAKIRTGKACSLIVIAMGPPGSGKGTQCRKLAKLLQIPHVSTGDMLRERLPVNSELCGKAKEVIAKGGLVPDNLVFSLILQRIAAADCAGGFILDGFPRTVEQALLLDAHLSHKRLRGRFCRKIVLQLNIRGGSLLQRLSGRRVCPSCASVFNVTPDTSDNQALCVFDGSQLVTREDDGEEAIARRLGIYERQTLPVLRYYAGREEIVEVDGDRPVDVVTAEALKAIIRYSARKEHA